MAEGSVPITRCEVCGYAKWQIRGMLICKNCNWRAEAAKAGQEKTKP
jgi:uncharacterized Zn finger protein (UPF0148 family)